MIPTGLVEHIRTKASLEERETFARIQDQTRQAHRAAAARGMLNSSFCINQVCDIHTCQLNVFSNLTWQIIHRVITVANIGLYEEKGNDLKTLFSEVFDECSNKIASSLKSELNRAKLPRGDEHWMNIFSAEVEHSRAKIHSEIDLYIIGEQARANNISENSGGSVVNFYSPVGTVQTGSHAVANVTQTIDASVRQQISNSLDLAQKAIDSLDSSSFPNKDDLLEIIVESRKEIQKEKPNNTKLRSFLSDTALALQTIASAKPAYDALKPVLAFFGVPLP